jgi:tetratricopeptide (TPR) repeat protein
MRAQLTPSEEAYLDLWAGLIHGDHDAAAAAGSRGFAIDPLSFAFPAGYVEMRRNRLESALSYFEHVDTVHAAFLPVRGFSPLPDFQSWALHLLGRHEEELAIALEARRRYPDNSRLRQSELCARVALGQAAEVERLVQEALNLGEEDILFLASREYRAHGQEDRAVEAAERLLEIYQNRCPPHRNREYCRSGSVNQLVFLERYEEALEIYREDVLDVFESRMAEGLPIGWGMLTRVGIGAALAGDSTLMSKADSLLAARDDPYAKGQITLWRAIFAAYSGHLEDAMALLRQAVDEGVPMGPSFHLSEWYEPLRGYPAFEEFVRPKG